MSDTSDFKRGQIVGARLAGASVTKAAGLCGVSRATVSRVMSAYNQEGRTTSNRSNCGRKRKLSERDVRLLTRIVSKRHITTAAQFTAELNVHLSSPVSTKTVRRELHRVNIYGRAAVPKSLVTCETTEDCPVESPKDKNPKSGGIPCKICPNSEPLLDDPPQPEAPSSD